MQRQMMGARAWAWRAGVVLGFGGSLLDFYSGYLLLATQQGDNGMMSVSSSSASIWGIGIAALGVVLVVTSTALVRPAFVSRMNDFGSLMLVYGAAMLFVGGSMLLGLTSLMGGSVLPGIGMLVLGFLMLANGLLMRLG